MFEVEAGTIPHGFGAWIAAQRQRLHSAPSSDPGYQLTSQILTSKCDSIWHGDGSISPSTAYEGCQTPVICLEWMQEPFHMGLEPQPSHKGKGFIQHQAGTRDVKSGPASVMVYGMMTDPYPHPQHMKVVKHVVYIWSGCRNHSTWVWRLNHHTKASFSTKQ